MIGRLYPNEDLVLDHKLVLAAADALVRNGSLHGFATPKLIQARDLVGNASFDIVLPALDGGRAWLVPLSSVDSSEDLAEWLADNLPGYLAARVEGEPLHNHIQERAASILADSATGVTIERSGIVIASRSWRVNRPALAIFLTALGADALPQRIRLEAAFEHDLSKAIEPVLETHRRAKPFAKRLTASGALGAVETTAYAFMRAHHFELGEVLTALKSQRRVKFLCGGYTNWTGWFEWRGFAIQAETKELRSFRLDGNTLCVRPYGLPESVLGSCEGWPLSMFHEQSPVPGDLIVQEAEQASPDEVRITLQSFHLPICLGLDGRPTVGPADPTWALSAAPC